MDSESARVRGYQPGDLGDLYRVCLRTADSGQDASGLFGDPELPGHVYMAPYVTFEPSLAFVAEDAVGAGGYIVAALDSLAFEQRLERDWWPALRARYPEPSPDAAASLPLLARRTLWHIHHPSGAPREVTDRFPSHLHINLLPRLQGRGAGRRLVATLLESLRDQGSPGVHLIVAHSNRRAAEFYRHVGFHQQGNILPASHIFAMGLRM